MTDLYATPTRFSWIFLGGPEVGEIHAGFGHALSDGWTKVVDAVRQVAPIHRTQSWRGSRFARRSSLFAPSRLRDPQLQSEQWRDFLARTIESFQEATEIFSDFNMDVGDHAISKYLQLVSGHQDALSRLFPV
jgi:hypothetical protein